MGLVTYNNQLIGANGKFYDIEMISPLPTIVSWADGTDEQLAAMLQAHYEGKLNIYDYWSVGDTRRVHLSAMSVSGYESHAEQDVEFTLMDTALTGIRAADNASLVFVVGMKDALFEKAYMNGGNTNTGGWNASLRRTWCNEVFANALPSTFKALFKQFKWKLYGGSGTTVVESVDTFALPPVKVVSGVTSLSSPYESALFDQWEWYETTENRIKKLGISGSGNAYWLSSADASNNTSFTVVNVDANVYSVSAGGNRGIAPFGCI